MAAPDPYRVLGVPPTATDAEVKAAWLTKVTASHPDRVQAEGPVAVQRAEDETKRLNAALAEIRLRRRRGERPTSPVAARSSAPRARPRPPPTEPREAHEALRVAERRVETLEAAAAEARRLGERLTTAPRSAPLPENLGARAREAGAAADTLETWARELEAQVQARFEEGGVGRARTAVEAARVALANGRSDAARAALANAESLAVADLARAHLRCEDLVVERKREAARLVRLAESTRDELKKRLGVELEAAARARSAGLALPAAETRWHEVAAVAEVAVATAVGLVEAQAGAEGLEPLLAQQWRTRAQSLRQALERARPPGKGSTPAPPPRAQSPIEGLAEALSNHAQRAREAFERLRPLFEAGAEHVARGVIDTLRTDVAEVRRAILAASDGRSK
jgi:hypothetical protein